MHRSEVYRLIEELQQLGLVQRNVTIPTTYTATPIAEGTKLLLQNKTSELNLICQKAKQITKKLCQTNGVNPAAFTAKSYLGTVFEGDRGRKYCSAIKEAQHTIELATTWSRFKQLIALFENPLQKALVKGITIHIVTEKPPDHRLPNWINTTLKKPNFNLKTLQNPIATTTMIFDHTQAAIAFNPNTSLIKGPDIWTNNQSLIALSQAYFDTIWSRQF